MGVAATGEYCTKISLKIVSENGIIPKLHWSSISTNLTRVKDR
jgi:hypothetical protein